MYKHSRPLLLLCSPVSVRLFTQREELSDRSTRRLLSFPGCHNVSAAVTRVTFGLRTVREKKNP